MADVQLWNAENGERIGETLSCPAWRLSHFSRDGSKIAVTCELNPESICPRALANPRWRDRQAAGRSGRARG